MFRKSDDDAFDGWIAVAAEVLISFGGVLALLMFSTLTLSGIT